MSNNKVDAAMHGAVSRDLTRRRELASMSKPEMISYIVMVENNLAALSARIEHAYGDEP